MTSTTAPTSATPATPSSTTPPAAPNAETPPSGALAGDLARRVTHRRNELGLSTDELARRAGLDAWFLAYFEQSSDTTLTGASLLRLAGALDTTPLALEGGLVDRAPGVGRAGAHPKLEELTAAECETHLAAGGIGRIVFTTESGPIALPVNFIFAGGAVLFRTSNAMADAISGAVAFEVDHIDEEMRSGWSVLARGQARHVEDPQERLDAGQRDLEPWAGGGRLNLIGITPVELTGRVIVQRSSHEQSSAPSWEPGSSSATPREQK